MSSGLPFNMAQTWFSGFRNIAEADPFPQLSAKCQDKLLELVAIFHDIDGAILDIINFDVDYGTQLYLKSSRLKDLDLSVLLNSFAHLSGKSAMSRTDRLQTLKADSPAKLNLFWSRAADALLERQGSRINSNDPVWELCKIRAQHVLDQRGDALEVFELIKEDLEQNTLFGLKRDILQRIRALDGFETAYNRQPQEGSKAEPVYRRKISSPSKSNISIAYSQVQRDRNATLLATVFATTLLAFIPTIFAWHRATDTPGTYQDVDFYLLIQNSAMQLLGLFTGMYPIYRRSTAHAWAWARGFTAIGVCCSLTSIPVYLYTPTMWSALLSFLGAAAQAGMALLLALMADTVDVSLKKD